MLISVIRKYKMLPLVATGLYSSRAELICISVSADICNFWVTSSVVFFVFLSTVMRLSSSTREPCVLVSLKSRLSSSSFIFPLLAVTSSIRSVLSFSSSCSSVSLTLPNSWSSRPFMVTVKSMIEVRALISGVYAGLGSLVVM
ncbi:hypothetical protein XENTR_v10017640 [Xenopus tropicalis]|nr:hypothetical protein XENTR_v10017640 [Xenopus tropicalis]